MVSLFRVQKSRNYELIIIDGISALLFIEDDIELVKEFESVLKRLSNWCTVVVTCNMNSEGNVIGHYLWNDVVPNNILVNRDENGLVTVTYYKYTVSSVKFFMKAN